MLRSLTRQMTLGLVIITVCTVAADAAPVVFTTNSTATQTITSPLFGGSVSLTSTGPQVFSIDPSTGFAGVMSGFTGSDFPDPLHPGQFLSYQLYNTTTFGKVAQNESGSYDISFEVLFELKITSGVLAGLTFETIKYGTFAASNVATLPLPPGTSFSDPTPPDTLGVYVKYSPLAILGLHSKLPIGTSSNRTVTADHVVP